MSNSKVVVVTGVSSGIGRATAEKFAKQGCRVFGTVRNTAKAQQIPGVELVEMDIRYEASIERGIQNNVQKAPQPDGVAATIVDAALGAWKMRRTPKGEASLQRKLRRLLPAGTVDAGLRKTFGLG